RGEKVQHCTRVGQLCPYSFWRPFMELVWMSRMVKKTSLAALALLLLTFVAPLGAARADEDQAPDLGDCQNLQVPYADSVTVHVLAVGVQIYSGDGTNWTFVAPQAVLFPDAEDHGVVGIHFGGPTWESTSGSQVVGTVIDRCTPDPAAIPWLLLGA